MKKYFFVLPLIASCSGLINKSNRMTNESQLLYNGGALMHETVSDHNNPIGCVTSTTVWTTDSLNSFVMAASYNNTSFFEEFIKRYNNKGPIKLMEEFKRKNIEGDNLFHIAAKKGNIDILITILDGLNSLDSQEYTPSEYTPSIKSFASDILRIRNGNGGGASFVDLLIEHKKIDALENLLNDSKSKGFYIPTDILTGSKKYANNCVKNNENIECSRRAFKKIERYLEDYEKAIEVYLIQDKEYSYIHNIVGPNSLEEFKDLENPNSIEPLIPNVPNIRNDITTHIEEKPHKCKTCGKGFDSLDKLDNHHKYHSIKKRHKCQLCDKSFITSYNLTDHKRIHTGERPYTCDICGRSFTQKGNMKIHIMSTHH